MNEFDPFVLPFTIGLYTLLIIFIGRLWEWIRRMPHEERMIILKGIFSRKIFGVIGEIFSESLLHRRIFKVNPKLGYMHMSLAFGWFLLIVLGNIEVKFISQKFFNSPWDPIFFKYFANHTIPWINHAMDFLLLFVLSGVFLAWLKRLRSKFLGLKRTTKQRMFDKIAITSLWLIFPLRLLAESMTAGHYVNGGFLTNPLGHYLGYVFPLYYSEYTVWWLYSIAVGTFFVALPFSRYMHIPTEIILISLRRFGFRTKDVYTPYTEIEVYSCSRCGICIDPCQLVESLDHAEAPPVYFLTSIRKNRVKADRSFNCLSCGRCQEVCPVGINLTGIRELQREKFVSNGANFSYLSKIHHYKGKVGYYAGCMTHLTPTIKRAMLSILDAAQEDYVFIDQSGTACCGRPMMLSGNFSAAQELVEYNRRTFIESEIEVLVTSCAICYRVFKEEYGLRIPVLHHSEYIRHLLRDCKIAVDKNDMRVVYHDPCDLGRGTKSYDAPREVLDMMVNRIPILQEKGKALCCGGSLSNIMVNQKERDQICQDALKELLNPSPNMLVTACPLCKKTFARNCDTPVKDIAEVVSMNLVSRAEVTMESIYSSQD